MRRSSQYIGLDQLYRHNSSPSPSPSTPLFIRNHPPILTQVNNGDKAAVSRDDPPRFFTPLGTVYPGSKHFLINSETSSIAQFRVQDFGMEDCQIAIDIPTTDALASYTPNLTSPYNLSLGPKNITLSDLQVAVDVWRLEYDSSRFIDASKLTWNTRPPRATVDPFATLSLSMGNLTTTTHFLCPSDTLQTFEFACASDDCNVNFWQDKEGPLLAVYILQRSSL